MDRSLSYIENRLVCGIKLANLRIFETACRDLRYKGMGTTIVSGLVVGRQVLRRPRRRLALLPRSAAAASSS